MCYRQGAIGSAMRQCQGLPKNASMLAGAYMKEWLGSSVLVQIHLVHVPDRLARLLRVDLDRHLELAVRVV